MTRLPELRAIECVTYAFAGHEPTSFQRIVELSTERAQLATRFRATMRELFDWAAVNQVPVYVVSASPRTAVEHALRTLGLAAAAVAGTELRTVGSRFVADLAGDVPYGSAKVGALRGLCGSASVVGAFGDDVRDRELLAIGRTAVAVCPTAELRACGAEIPHLCELDLSR
jgi:phosphoserine phosphatase